MTRTQLVQPQYALDEFDDIRPFQDSELAAKIAELVRDPALIRSVCLFTIPRIYKVFPAFVRWLWGRRLRGLYRNIRTVHELQVMLSRYVQHVVRTSTDGFTVSGSENLPRDKPCLFLSNHRDIVLDSALLILALLKYDISVPQIAIGDNLFSSGYERDLMRLNRGFRVIRASGSRRDHYKSLIKTSRYIRKTLDQGESVWISQREGRSKDGKDLTDPAILKMIMLAYREEFRDFETWLECVNVIPVTATYEIDPCAPMKAQELYTKVQTGTYEKEHREDFRSIVQGIRGYKGRVHIAFSPQVTPPKLGEKLNGKNQLDEDSLAERIDRSIQSGIQQYPTFLEAKRRLNGKSEPILSQGAAKEALDAQLASLEPDLQQFLLMQYANQVYDWSN